MLCHRMNSVVQMETRRVLSTVAHGSCALLSSSGSPFGHIGAKLVVSPLKLGVTVLLGVQLSLNRIWENSPSSCWIQPCILDCKILNVVKLNEERKKKKKNTNQPFLLPSLHTQDCNELHDCVIQTWIFLLPSDIMPMVLGSLHVPCLPPWIGTMVLMTHPCFSMVLCPFQSLSQAASCLPLMETQGRTRKSRECHLPIPTSPHHLVQY